MSLNQIRNELDELWAAAESRRPDRGLKWLGYWMDEWKTAYNKGDEEVKKLLVEVEELLSKRKDDGVLKLVKSLLMSSKNQ